MSLPVTWHNDGTSGLQKNSLTLRGYTTKSSQTPWCQTFLLCNSEARDTAFLECLNKKRSAYTFPTSANLAPQLCFPEGGEWVQPPWRSPFVKKIPHAHLAPVISQPAYELILPLSRMKCKSQMLENKGVCTCSMLRVISQHADFCNMTAQCHDHIIISTSMTMAEVIMW